MFSPPLILKELVWTLAQNHHLQGVLNTRMSNAANTTENDIQVIENWVRKAQIHPGLQQASPDHRTEDLNKGFFSWSSSHCHGHLFWTRPKSYACLRQSKYVEQIRMTGPLGWYLEWEEAGRWISHKQASCIGMNCNTLGLPDQSEISPINQGPLPERDWVGDSAKHTWCEGWNPWLGRQNVIFVHSQEFLPSCSGETPRVFYWFHKASWIRHWVTIWRKAHWNWGGYTGEIGYDVLPYQL